MESGCHWHHTSGEWVARLCAHRLQRFSYCTSLVVCHSFMCGRVLLVKTAFATVYAACESVLTTPCSGSPHNDQSSVLYYVHVTQKVDYLLELDSLHQVLLRLWAIWLVCLEERSCKSPKTDRRATLAKHWQWMLLASLSQTYTICLPVCMEFCSLTDEWTNLTHYAWNFADCLIKPVCLELCSHTDRLIKPVCMKFCSHTDRWTELKLVCLEFCSLTDRLIKPVCMEFCPHTDRWTDLNQYAWNFVHDRHVDG